MSDKKMEEIRAWFQEGLSGRSMTGRVTTRVDSILQSVFNSEFHEENLVLIATGGYGRAEMAPFSDVDIMFFAPDRKETEAAERVLYKLWDTGLDISHSFRTPDECVEESLKDIRTRTSLLEARYVAGDRKLFRIFRNEVYPEIAYRRQKEFVGGKLMEMGKRHLSSGDSVYLLEPHIKEGEGGLRDVHTAYWISKVALRIENTADFLRLLNPYDYRRFLSAYDFLLRARFSLHLESRRKNDILSFEYQKAVAENLGFRDSLKFSAAERLLRYYYLKSRTLKDLTRRIMVTCSRPYVDQRRDMNIRKITDEFSVSGGRLIATKDDLFARGPDKVLECFYLYAKTGKKFSDTLKDNIRASLIRISARIRSSAAAVHYFLDILKSDRVYDTLREMHETGVLGRFIPEFGALRLLVVHEPYHMYTVDEHTLIALRNLEALRTTHYGNLEDLHVIVNRMERVDVLYMALLFHDIGKAVGRHHEEEGYKRLKNIMERFNLDIKKRARIEFLVRNHILMSRIALRRETSDTEVIAKFADDVGDPENLKAIYLITYADMSAVNPGFWTSWKAYLLRDLYEHTLDYLSGIKEDRTEYIKSLRDLSGHKEFTAVVDFVQEMPDRYIISTTKSRVLEDCRLVRKVKETGFAMRIDSSQEGVVEMSICALDCPGLFSKVVGFLSAKGLNIVGGRIFTGKNGIVIDKIAVSNWEDVWWDGLADDLEKGLKGIIIDGKPVNIIRRYIKAESPFDVFIELDNEVSDVFSLIEIFSPDRLGLLYDISDVMYRKGVNIVSARINTEAGLAQDLFYVQSHKQKINYTEAEGLLSELWTVLKGSE